METLLQSLKSRLSFKNATLFLCLFNLITALFLLHAFFSSSSSSSPRFPSNHPISVQLRQIQESEEIRRAMQPLELIQRVWEIEHEINAEPETGQHKETKQTAAFDLSKRLSNAHTVSDSASLKVYGMRVRALKSLIPNVAMALVYFFDCLSPAPADRPYSSTLFYYLSYLRTPHLITVGVISRFWS